MRDGDPAIQFLTVATTPDKNLQSAELVFDRLGKREFLRDVLVPGDVGAQTVVSSSEHQAEKAAMKAAEQHAVAAERHPVRHKETKQQY